jgi:hypothetical protein
MFLQRALDNTSEMGDFLGASLYRNSLHQKTRVNMRNIVIGTVKIMIPKNIYLQVYLVRPSK